MHFVPKGVIYKFERDQGRSGKRPIPFLALMRGRGFLSPQQVWQLRDIERDPPRLVAREQLGRRSPARFILVIDIGDLLAVGMSVRFTSRDHRSPAADRPP
jgi:hypothetical protein